MKKGILLLTFGLMALLLGALYACQKDNTDNSPAVHNGQAAERTGIQVNISGGAHLFICGISGGATACTTCSGASGTGEFITSNNATYMLSTTINAAEFSLSNPSGSPISVTITADPSCPTAGGTYTIPANIKMTFQYVSPSNCLTMVGSPTTCH